jgi:NifB/MoaA-like Fe-S oxidoreductase
LTRFSRVKSIRRPSAAEAVQALRQTERWEARLRASLGVGFVYASDELRLLAGCREMPPSERYDGFPVLMNGVGLLRSMLDEWRQHLARTPQASLTPARSVVWLTGRTAAVALERMAEDFFQKAGWRPRVVTVDNAYFGGEVSVSGLLTGADLIDALRQLPADVQDCVLPRGPFGFDGTTTLDGVSAQEVGAAHPGRVHLASTPRELLTIMRRPGGAARPSPARAAGRARAAARPHQC